MPLVCRLAVMAGSYTIPYWYASIITGIAENGNNDDCRWKGENIPSEKGQKQSLETLSAVASAFDVNVSDLSEENYVASQALDERIREAKTQIAQETQFYRILVTAVLVCTALKITNYFLPRKVTGPLWSLLSGEDLSYSGE